MADFTNSNIFTPLRFNLSKAVELIQEQDKIAIGQARAVLQADQQEFDQAADLATREARIKEATSRAALNSVQARTMEAQLPFAGEKAKLVLGQLQVETERGRFDLEQDQQFGDRERESTIKLREAQTRKEDALSTLGKAGAAVAPYVEGAMESLFGLVDPEDPVGSSERLGGVLRGGNELEKLLQSGGRNLWGAVKEGVGSVIRGFLEFQSASGDWRHDLVAVTAGTGYNTMQDARSLKAANARVGARLSEGAGRADQVSGTNFLDIYGLDREQAWAGAESALEAMRREWEISKAAERTESPALTVDAENAEQKIREAITHLSGQMIQMEDMDRARSGEPRTTVSTMEALKKVLPGLFAGAINGGEGMARVEVEMSRIGAYPVGSNAIAPAVEPYLSGRSSSAEKLQAGLVVKNIMSRLPMTARKNIKNELQAVGMWEPLNTYTRAYEMSPNRATIDALSALGGGRELEESAALGAMLREVELSAETFSARNDEGAFASELKATDPEAREATDEEAFDTLAATWFSDSELKAPSREVLDRVYYESLTTPRFPNQSLEAHVHGVISRLSNSGAIGPGWNGGDRETVHNHPAKVLRTVLPSVGHSASSEYFWHFAERDVLAPFNEEFGGENRQYKRGDVRVREVVMPRRVGDERTPAIGYLFVVNPDAAGRSTGDEQFLNKRTESGAAIPWTMPTDQASLIEASDVRHFSDIAMPFAAARPIADDQPRRQISTTPSIGLDSRRNDTRKSQPEWARQIQSQLGDRHPENRRRHLLEIRESEMMKPIRELWKMSRASVEGGGALTEGVDLIGRLFFPAVVEEDPTPEGDN